MRAFPSHASSPSSLLEWWFTVPTVVICLYAIFRWRRFGEDSYTWNHQYFKLALAFGLAICALGFLATNIFSESWQYAGLWTFVFLGTALTLRFARYQDWTNTVLLSVALAVLGWGSVPVAGMVRHALYRPVKWTPPGPLTGIPRSTFSPDFPPGWQEQPGQSPHTYKCAETDSGLLKISLFPPPDGKLFTGAGAEQDLLNALDAVTKDMNLGVRISVAHEEAAAGPMAFADYATEKHGPVRFWMILSETRVFASYTDGKSPVAEREIAEIHAVLKAARFTHSKIP